MALGGGVAPKANQLHGVEIHADSAVAAAATLGEAGLSSRIDVSDFFDVDTQHKYDVVLGNPPYVRYQNFSGRARARSQELALALGVRISGLASSWAAFVLHAADHLAPDGRLALVLPAELLSVGYASTVRAYLLRRFGAVRLIAFEERVFPGVLEDVVLLLAEGSGGADFFKLHQTRNVASLVKVESAKWVEHSPTEGAKWTPALVAQDAFATYKRVCGATFETLGDWGTTYLGAVTGNNRYFALTQTEAVEAGLASTDLLAISPPGSRHLRGFEFTKAAWEAEAKAGARCLLFYPNSNLASAPKRYIDRGFGAHVDKAYKCRVRAPWWRVPLVEVPDLLLTYMNHDRPRLISNPSGLHILNSVYGVRLHRGHKMVGRELLPLASLNSVTLLGAEVVGRAYGGGLLKLEPREADKLPVPSLALIEEKQELLLAMRPQMARALRNGDISAAVKAVDEVILAGLPPAELSQLRAARELLFDRRKARATGD